MTEENKNEFYPSAQDVARKTNVKIVNETGVIDDVRVYIDDKLMDNIVSVEISPMKANTPFVTAKIEFLGVKLDILAEDLKS